MPIASHMSPLGDPAHNPGMCLDQELTQHLSVCRPALNPLSHRSQGHCFFIQPTSIHTLKRVLQIFLTDLVIELHTPCLSLCLLRSRDNKHHQARLICFSLIRKISFICTQHFLCPFFLDRRIFPLNDQPCYLHSLSSGYNSPSHSKETYFQILKCVLFSTFIY